jgi:hypothetical protein
MAKGDLINKLKSLGKAREKCTEEYLRMNKYEKQRETKKKQSKKARFRMHKSVTKLSFRRSKP